MARRHKWFEDVTSQVYAPIEIYGITAREPLNDESQQGRPHKVPPLLYASLNVRPGYAPLRRRPPLLRAPALSQ